MRDVDGALQLANILNKQNIATLFQPIWDHQHQEVIGYEALSRGPENTPLYSPSALLNQALKDNKEIQLEWLCIKLAVQRAAELGFPERVFVNISPHSLLNNMQYSQEQLIYLNQQHPITIELTESQPFQFDVNGMKLLENLRHENIELALDDFGSGYSNLQVLLQFEPHYLKLDGFFADTLLHNPHTASALEQLFKLAEHLDSTVIAEKVETQEQYELLARLNIRCMQGYFIQKPSARMQCLSHLEKFAPPLIEEPYTAATLLHRVPSVKPELPSQKLLQRMRQDKTLISIAVTDAAGQVLGIVRRNELLERHSGPFGHSLNQRTTVRDLMDTNSVIVESHWPLSEIGKRLSHADASGLDAAFIITHQGIYQGLGYAQELMRRLSDYKLQLARYANPLTQLPGNVPLHRTLQSLMGSQQSFEIAYFDLNNFKPFNDCCGYERGDQMIRLVAELLTQYLRPYAHFIGHLGGDDFIVIFTDNQWQSAIRCMLKAFRKRSLALYRHQDIENGGILSFDRNGKRRFFPLTQLAVGITCWHRALEPSLEKLSEIASFAKKQAKEASDNYYYFYRPTAESILE
ncbi:MAG: hypothetical protein CENE_03712 [Candidatus Celerinatantimonas neptuna]|nr:MAG: hypothetical protein CENE_03712 [Candidatus Celerinatantimonas neptuna]